VLGVARLAGWLAAAVVAGGAVGIAAGAFDIHPVRVTSGSMSSTIEVGDWIVTRDVDGGQRGALRRGDIVMFRFPVGTTGRAVKRVVALEGDRVAIGARRVRVNGRAIPIAGAPTAGAARARVETVPHGSVFLLGDNARRSLDSRSFGPVLANEIVARELVVVGQPGWTWAVAAIAVALCVLLLVVAWSACAGVRRPARVGPQARAATHELTADEMWVAAPPR
jgi:signal peptidase I